MTSKKKQLAPQNLACNQCSVKDESMFAGLCAHSISEISENKTCSTYKKGQLLFHEGARPMGVFCINKGKVKVYRTGIDGKEQIVQIAKEGDLLGYRAMIGEEYYPVSAETLEESAICLIPKSNFLTALEEDNILGKRIIKKVCGELGIMTENLTNLAQRSVRERLAITLLMLKDTYGTDEVQDAPAAINLTREDMANMVGTATETLIRLLHDLKEEGLIRTEGRKIFVLDPKGLTRVGNLY